MERKTTLRSLLYRYRHAWVFSYFFFYLIWFVILEKTVVKNYTVMHVQLDDRIPFQEIFVIPYFLWFLYIAAVVFYFFFTSKEDFYKCTAFLFIGMTVCLIIYTIWPNGQDLRPEVFPRENILTTWIKWLYLTDTPSNVCPSIHVFNSIGAHIAIVNSKHLRNKKWVCRISLLLAVLISLSTVFIKQHSVLDGFCSIILSIVMYLLIYVPNYTWFFAPEVENTKENIDYKF